MNTEIILIAVAISSTHFLTRWHLIDKNKVQPFVRQQTNRKTQQQKQLEMHLFLAKLLIGYLVACIALLLTRLS